MNKRQTVLTAGLSAACIFVGLAGGALAGGSDSTGRSEFWHRAGQGSPSVDECRKQFKENPADASAANDLGWALRQHGDLSGAKEALIEALKLAPKMPQAHSNFSVVLLDGHDFASAVEQARRAVALDGGQPVFHVVLANALSGSGDRKAAIEEYRAALKIRPDYENAMYHLGTQLFEDGQLLEAKKQLSYALKLDPSDERVVAVLDQIMKAETAAAAGNKSKEK